MELIKSSFCGKLNQRGDQKRKNGLDECEKGNEINVEMFIAEWEKTLMFVECNVSWIWLEKLLLRISYWEYYSEAYKQSTIRLTRNWRKASLCRHFYAYRYKMNACICFVKFKKNLQFNRHSGETQCCTFKRGYILWYHSFQIKTAGFKKNLRTRCFKNIYANIAKCSWNLCSNFLGLHLKQCVCHTLNACDLTYMYE